MCVIRATTPWRDGSLEAVEVDPAEDEQAQCKEAGKRSADRAEMLYCTGSRMQQVVRVS